MPGALALPSCTNTRATPTTRFVNVVPSRHASAAVFLHNPLDLNHHRRPAPQCRCRVGRSNTACSSETHPKPFGSCTPFRRWSIASSDSTRWCSQIQHAAWLATIAPAAQRAGSWERRAASVFLGGVNPHALHRTRPAAAALHQDTELAFRCRAMFHTARHS
jgi:hypothetical protein